MASGTRQHFGLLWGGAIANSQFVRNISIYRIFAKLCSSNLQSVFFFFCQCCLHRFHNLCAAICARLVRTALVVVHGYTEIHLS